MELNKYQEHAHATSHNTEIGGDRLLYPVLGLAGEAGELVNKLKKVYRDNGGTVPPDVKWAIASELGDILWYVAEIATQLQIELNTVATDNVWKLASRANRGVIGGSGDNR